MFIVDHAFSDEPKAPNHAGSIIIKALTKEMPDSSYCFLFTHEVKDRDSEENLRKEIIRIFGDKDQKSQSRFSVVSKTSIDFSNKETLADKLGEVIKVFTYEK